MRVRTAAMIALLLISLLAMYSSAHAYDLYTSDYSGNMFYVDSNTWSVTPMGVVQNSALATLGREMAMDFSPDGGLYAYTFRSQVGQLARRYHYGEVYAIDPATVGDNTVGDATEPSNENFGYFGLTAGTVQPNYDAGLAFRNDGRFFTAGFSGSSSGNQIVLNDLDASTPAETFTKSNYFTYRGLEWYDDGSANGMLLGLNSSLQMELLNLNYATHGFSSGSFAALPVVAGMTMGDLSIRGDTLYALLSGASGSKVYSYDLTQGIQGAFQWEADFSQANLKSLAAEPATTPEPASMVLLGIGLAGLAARRWKGASNVRA